jgi:hypothetical protein
MILVNRLQTESQVFDAFIVKSQFLVVTTLVLKLKKEKKGKNPVA